MKTIFLYGDLKEKFGGPFTLDVKTPVEAIRALGFQIKGFLDHIKEGRYRLLRGDISHAMELGEDQIHFGFGRVREFHIIPAIEGAKSAGGGKIVLGAVIAIAAIVAAPVAIGAAGSLFGSAMGAEAFTALGFSVSYGSIAAFGASMAFRGAASLLAGTPGSGDYTSRNAPDQRPSYLFTGPVNVSQPGTPVPIVYGQALVGSVVISAGITTEQVATA